MVLLSSYGLSQGDTDLLKKELADSKAFVRKNPFSHEAYYLLGIAYTKNQMYLDAKEAFRESLRIKPDYPQAHYGLGVIHFIRDSGYEFLLEYQLLKNLNPGMADSLYTLLSTREVKFPVDKDETAKETVSKKDDILPIEAIQPEPAQSQALQQPEPVHAHASPQKEPVSQDKIAVSKEKVKPEKKKMFSVQMGLFREENNAVVFAGSLKKKGHDSFIRKGENSEGKTFYRVLIGRYEKNDDAMQSLKDIQKREDLKPVIVRIESAD